MSETYGYVSAQWSDGVGISTRIQSKSIIDFKKI